MKYKITTTNPIVRDGVYSRLFELGFEIGSCSDIDSVQKAKKVWSNWDRTWNYTEINVKTLRVMSFVTFTGIHSDTPTLSLDKLFSNEFAQEVKKASEPPKPEYRPWEGHEVKYGHGERIRNKGTKGFGSLICAVNSLSEVWTCDNHWRLSELFLNWEFSNDDGKTWGVCGVKIN